MAAKPNTPALTFTGAPPEAEVELALAEEALLDAAVAAPAPELVREAADEAALLAAAEDEEAEAEAEAEAESVAELESEVNVADEEPEEAAALAAAASP